MNTSRVEHILDLAQAQGLDALAVMPGPNLLYMIGLPFHLSERPVLAVFPVDAPPALIVPVFEASKAASFEVFAYTDEDGYALAFHEACAVLELPEARIGVEALQMRLLEARALQRYAPGAILTPADDLFVQLRMVKEVEELAAQRRAIAVAERAFLAWYPQLRVGMTEKEAAARLIATLLTHGAEALAFDPIVASGPNGALPHATPGGRALCAGDWLIVDWGAQVDGYLSDITRMVVLGEPAGPLLEAHRIVVAANAAGRGAVRSGIHAQAVDVAARAVITEAGFGAHFTHRTGHGLGLEIHEPPYLLAGNVQPLRAGMTFTVEPGIYLEGVGGIRIEDDVLVTETGQETLTTLPREPFVVPM